MITPAEIQNKEFSKGFRGYNEEEVDMFLDLITIDLEKLIKENINLKAQISTIEKKEEAVSEADESVKDTLLSAKSLMEELAASSEKRANALLHNAELDAALIIKEAKMKADRLVAESKDLTNSFEKFKKDYKSLLERQLDMFKKEIIAIEDDKFLSEISQKSANEDNQSTTIFEEVVQPPVSEGYDVSDIKKTMVNIKLD